jgi:hypothetical protein
MKLREYLQNKNKELKARELLEKVEEAQSINQMKAFINQIEEWLSEYVEAGLITIGQQSRQIGEKLQTSLPVLDIHAAGKQIPIYPIGKKVENEWGVQVGDRFNYRKIWLQKEDMNDNAYWVYKREGGETKVDKKIIEEIIYELLSENEKSEN